MAFRDPHVFAGDPDGIEVVEKSTARFVSEAVYQIIDIAARQFASLDGVALSDKADYLGEDLTRLALDRIGAPRVPEGRIFGAVDYKLATYQFLPDFSVRQALFVDSKAEEGAFNNLRMQVTQTSMVIRQSRGGEDLDIPGTIPCVWESESADFLTTTMFVKWHYGKVGGGLELKRVSVVSIPNGMLQDRYNPSVGDNIWNAGPDAPTLGEKFRTRVNFTKLISKSAWRVQVMVPGESWFFTD